jgi:hypothetical protein
MIEDNNISWSEQLLECPSLSEPATPAEILLFVDIVQVGIPDVGSPVPAIHRVDSLRQLCT